MSPRVVVTGMAAWGGAFGRGVDRLVDALRRDAVRKDAVRRDAVRKDALRRAAVRKDALRRDAVRKDAVQSDERRFRTFEGIPDSPWVRSRLAALDVELRSGVVDPWPDAVRLAVDLAREAVEGARLDIVLDGGSIRTAVVNGTMHGSEADLEFARQRVAGPPDPHLYARHASTTALEIARRIGAPAPG